MLFRLVAPGGCVTYLANLTKYVVANPNFVPLTNAGGTEFLLRPGEGAFPGQGIVDKGLSEANLSGRVGLDWQASANDLLYAYVARGFKSGAFPNVSANVATQYDAAKQEELIDFEGGFKTRSFGDVVINGAAFYYDYFNKQVFGYVPDIVYGSLNRIVNIPRSHLYGVEGEVSFPLAAGLTAHGSATYIRSRIDAYTGYDDFGVPRNFKGDSFAFTPKFQGNAVLSYNFDVTETSHAMVNLVGNYSDSQKGDLVGNPLFSIRPYFVMDANAILSLDNDKYELGLGIKNLTNKYYWTSVQLNEDSLVRYAAMPITWELWLKAKF